MIEYDVMFLTKASGERHVSVTTCEDLSIFCASLIPRSQGDVAFDVRIDVFDWAETAKVGDTFDHGFFKVTVCDVNPEGGVF